jgi:hypothetical protein
LQVTDALNLREQKALKALRFECDYEDSHKDGIENFISWGALGTGLGDKTRTDLLQRGFIVSGPIRWNDDTGYRITTAGREALTQSRGLTET